MTGHRETLSRLQARHEAPAFLFLSRAALGGPRNAAPFVACERRFRASSIVTMFDICSRGDMGRIERQELSAILLAAPGWARVGLTMPDARLRERAADTLAATMIEKLQGTPTPDINQLRLSL